MKWLFGLCLVIVTISLYLNSDRFNDFPNGIHAWSQADHYALSLGFVENGLNFFSPQTNYLFPDHPEGNGITPVDFPIHHYLPAVFMKLTGVRATWPMRSYLWIYSIIGLLYLFKLTELITFDRWKAAFVTLFALTSPVFLFYHATFLPTIPSIANVLIGLYFYFRFQQSNLSKHLWLGVVFVTLAALSRTPFALFLVAMILQELLLFKQSKAKPLLLLLGGFLVLLIQYLWNHHMTQTFHSLFLGKPLPATSFEEFTQVLNLVQDKWSSHYFTVFHYAALFGLLLLAMYHLLVKNRAMNRFVSGFGLYTGLVFCGATAYALLMLTQFRQHDYYFLDSYYLILVFILIFSLASLTPLRSKKHTLIFHTTLTVLIVGMLSKAKQTHDLRMEMGQGNRIAITAQNFEGAGDFLTQFGVAQDARLLIIDAYAPPIPLLLSNRKGFTVENTSAENLEKAMTWSWDYAIMQDRWIKSDVLDRWPQATNYLHRVGGNGNISIYERKAHRILQTWPQFMGKE